MTALAPESLRDQLINRRYEPSVAAINELCDSLQGTKPDTVVPYVDPIHDVDQCRIISLYSNIGEADASGFITPGDDGAVERMAGIQWKLGMRPEYVMPWNVHPWHTPGEANGKFTPDQISAGLKPLLKFLALVPRASVIVAHGTEANRLANLLLKTEVPLLWRRGLKTYKVRSLSGRAFAGSAARQEQYIEDMHVAYADAMARTGLTPA
ncbi:uracil-DNA glycosylase [Pseudarthrobacter sp. J75]|uniref:uracil-DNA glycosylase n=1 Tax=unclassified Pseudarthrobacter TaxID=2647000 RepID=UPI002E80C9DE|nr:MULTISPECIES: uracil-DNA glycosylase [unclassified Pseudarthrobacter]MEE2522610.1 uracil-DNA glycosylase [Pseudarthrobacter sp. J47]MEE2530717.1 uracil-DNA glycosylase [Pseudarthrobacter sp. J75]MEE2571029.1 uracil-DNA glycosylase [Pseudarthrobacter sp. J64]